MLQELTLRVEHADAGGAEELVAGEGEEVAIERLDIDGMVGDELCRIDEDARACGVGARDDSLEIWLYSKDIALAGDGDEVNRVFCKDAVEIFVVQFASVMDIDPVDVCPALHPWDDVRVVFEFGKDNGPILPAPHPSPLPMGEGVGDEVDGFGAILREDDFFRVLCVEEALYLPPRAFVALRRLLREGVHAAVSVGILRPVVCVHCLEDAFWFLRGSRVIEVCERMAGKQAPEDGESAADFVKGERHIETIGLG